MLSMNGALSVFRSSLSLLRLGHLRSLLFLKLSAGAAPLRRSRSALVLAALSVAVAGAQPAADGWTIDTVAGSSYRGDGGAATAAQLNWPRGVAADGAGNLYIADTFNHRIRKVDAAGVISTVAGDGTQGYGGDGGPATAAQLRFPNGVALDGAGNLYFADGENDRIRKVDAAGTITTVAGYGPTGEVGGGFGGDGGPAVAARLNFPAGVALDGAGNLYFADANNNRIRKVDAAGVISTVAGDGVQGFGGDGGPATAAQLYLPRGVALDGAGNLYIADRYNHRIRKVDAAGVISTVAGDGTEGFGGDGGPAVAAQLSRPYGVALDGAGNLYIVDLGNQRIRKVDAAGVISTVAGDGTEGFGGDGGAATAAQLSFPAEVAPDGAGNLYIADGGNNRIRKVDSAGAISTVAGGGPIGDGGAAVAAQLNSPGSVAPDGAGNLYIADLHNHRIRKVDAAGVITTAAGDGTRGYGGDGGAAVAAQLSFPRDVAPDGAGNLYIADSANHRIRKVDAAGVISTVAGDGTRGYGGDGGPATAAQLSSPYGVAADGAGNLYIADTFNHRIRKVDAAGVISTVAGDGTRGYSGDGGAATAAQLRYPQGVAADGAGNLYIADRVNHRIRKVDAAGVISTVAGDGTRGSGGDGGPATAAQLNSPRGVAPDGAGNLYIADLGNHRIRKVDAAGVISTVAGDGTEGFGGDGGPATAAQLNRPAGVALDGAGNLYIADSGNGRIRRLTSAAMPPPSISAGGVVLATQTPLVSRISPNALISVFGQGFAPPGTLATDPTLNPAGRVAANLAATCLQIGGKRAPLFVVTPGQINAQVPHDLAPGEAALTVTRGCGTANEQRSAAASATVAAVSPAFFNFVSNPNGRNPVVALHGGGPGFVGTPGLLGLLPGVEFTPAAPGEVVTLYGTGFGATEPALETGEIAAGATDLANAVSFTFGGIAVPPADILYKGAAPGLAGVYQFAVRLPSNLPDGNADVVATVNGVPTPSGPFLTVRVAGGGGTTTDDHGDTPAEATALSPGSPAQGRIETGSDVDYFRLRTTAESDVEIYTSGSLDTTGSLHDSANNRIVENDDGGTGSNFRIARRLSAGVYYIAVSSSGSRTGSYTLHARVTGVAPPPSNRAGVPLTPGQPANFRLGPVDNPTIFRGDYSYRLEVPENASRVTFALNSADPDVDVDLFVRFGEDNVLRDRRVVSDYSSETTSGNERIVITRSSDPPLRAGTYYASLALFDTGVVAEGTLTATIETGGGGTTTDDHGDTPAAATALSPGSPAQGRIETGSDVDYFRLRTTAESDVEIYTSGSLDTRGSLHDSANNRIVENDDGGTGSNFRIARRLSAGVYYIAVSSFGSRTGSYTLHARVTAAPPPSNRAGGPLTPGQPAPFRLGPVDNPTIFHGDYSYRLEVPANATRVTFSLQPNESVDMSLRVRFGEDIARGQDRSWIADYFSRDRSQNNERIVITRSSDPPLRAGTYYAALSLWDTGVVAEGTLTATIETGGGGTTTDDHGDTPAEATALSPGSPVQGRIETAGDVDYFRLRTTAESNVVIYTSGSLDTTGSLHDSANNRIVGNDDGGTGTNFRIERRLSAGVYYIAVRGYGGSRTGRYTLTATIETVGGGGGGTTPDDHGDTPAEATALSPGSPVQGRIETGSDVDYFRLRTTAAGNVVIYTSGSLDTTGSLHDSANNRIVANDDGGTGTNFRIERRLSAGVYYIAVRSSGSPPTGSYTLTATIETGGGGGGGTTPDDHGDTPAAATALSPGSPVQGRIETAGDVDYFRLRTTAESDVEIYTSGSLDTTGSLHDSANNRIVGNDDGGTGTNFRIARRLSAGVYYIAVRGYGGSRTGRYTLTATIETVGGGGGGTTPDDHGDTPAEATALSPGSPVQGRIETAGDVDYFRLRTTAAGNVVIYTSGSLDTTGSLHDSANNRIVANDDSGAGTNFRIERRLSAGVYYIAVRGYGGSRTGRYTLTATIETGGGGGGGTTPDDHGDTPAAATALSPGSPVQGRIETGSDVDYFRLRTTAASNVVIYTSGSLDTTGSLHDSSNNRIVANDDGGTGRNFRIARRLSAGVYYIAVRSSGSRTGSYTLHARVTVAPPPDVYTPLASWTVADGRVTLAGLTAGRCITLGSGTINGVSYTVHTSKWQRRGNENSPWTDIARTERRGQLCAYTTTQPGQYRGVADLTIDGERGMYSSANFFTKE